MACVVCDGNDLVTSTNPTFVCEDCGINVHKLCYGITAKSGNIDPWWCAPCGLGQNRAMCQLCLQYGGALKPTACGHWVHVVCALFTEGTIFMNKQRMEPINISNIPQENHGQKCIFCLEVRGICGKCSDPNCDEFLHITCGQNNNCLREKNNSRNTKIIFEAYCRRHKPKSSHRLSSVFVVDTLAAKDNLSGQKDYDIIETVDISSGAGDQSFPGGSFNHSATNSCKEGENGANESEIVVDRNASCSQYDENDAGNTLLSDDKIETVDISSDAGDHSFPGGSFNHSSANSSKEGENGANKSEIVADLNASCSQYDENEAGNTPLSDDNIENAKDSKANADNDDDPVSDSSFIRQFWWDYFELEAQLRSKDSQIEKLEAKKQKLKGKVRNLEAEKKNLQLEVKRLNLQLEIERLNSQIQQQLVVSKPDNGDASCSSGCPDPQAKNDCLTSLKNRIASKSSEDGTELVYANGISISAKLTKQLEMISSDPESDRTYINAHFVIVFPEHFILERMEKGLSRENVLSEFRESDRYQLLKDLFEYRARCNGKGDLDARMSLFKLAFRTKFNNWWAKNAPKNAAEKMPTE